VTDFKKVESNHHQNQLNKERAWKLHHLYEEIVELQRQEGLIIKDLSSPYVFGTFSRGLGYWRKLKPDYDGTGHASDIDVVVLGGFFCNGFEACRCYWSLSSRLPRLNGR